MQSPWQRFLALVSLGILWASPVGAQTWDDLRSTIRRRFPQVRQLSTAELASWLSDRTRPAPLLVDARSRDEFAVSQLPGARHAESLDAVEAILPAARATPKNVQPIVVYCSVGYRSSALAAKLMAAGWTNVFNLEGSIFAWANEGRPVQRGTNRVEIVHPFDPKWGQLLDRRYHPPSPADPAPRR
jgi:rhodanese-related sulfurtransferase